MIFNKVKRHQRVNTISYEPSQTGNSKYQTNMYLKRLKSALNSDYSKRKAEADLSKSRKRRHLQSMELQSSVNYLINNAVKKIEQIEKHKQFVSLKRIASLAQKKKQDFRTSDEQINQKGRQLNKLSKNNKKIIINLSNTKYNVVQNASKQLSFKIKYNEVTSPDNMNWDFKWTDVSLGPQFIKKLHKDQRINYFIGISSIARKNLLMNNLYAMKQSFPEQYNFFPETFQCPNEMSQIKKFYKDKMKKHKNITFIVKPQAGCQGKGIYLTQDLSEIDTNFKSIVQEYISKPMLYEGLKFDFRVYVLLKSINPLEIYIYKEGLVRLATQTYVQPNESNLDDLCLHLTNYSINKLNPKYQFNKTFKNLKFGHKKSLAQFFKYLQSISADYLKAWRNIKQNIIKTIISIQPHLNYQFRKAQPKNQNENLCYQVLGFDFMMDDKMKVFLLQVNQSPSFSTQTPLDFLVKNYLIKDTFKILLYDFQKKKINLQLRLKNIKTRSSFETQITSQNNQTKNNQIPRQLIGNYEKIYPTFDTVAQRRYQKMLLVCKSNYYNPVPLESRSFRRKQVSEQKIIKKGFKQPQLKGSNFESISKQINSLPEIQEQTVIKSPFKKQIQTKIIPKEYISLKKHVQNQQKTLLKSNEKSFMGNSSNITQKLDSFKQQSRIQSDTISLKQKSEKQISITSQELQNSLINKSSQKSILPNIVRKSMIYLNPLEKIIQQRQFRQKISEKE